MPLNVGPLQFPGIPHGSQSFISPHLRMALTFYPHGSIRAPDAFVQLRDVGMKRITSDPKETQASLTSFRWNKAMGQPSGSWEATIKQRVSSSSPAAHPDPFAAFGSTEFQDFAIDGDWCDVEVIRNGLPIPLCRGPVDTLREQTTSVGGAKVVVWTITGRDHGAFFEYPITYNNMWVKTIGELTQGLFTERVKGKIGGRPDEMFKVLIEATFARGRLGAQWELPPSLADTTGLTEGLWDLLKVITFSASQVEAGLRGGYYNEPLLWTTGGQQLHQTLHQWCNPMLNEMWYDLLLPAQYLPEHGLNSFLPFASVTVEEATLPSLTAEGQRFGTMAAFIRERPFFNTIEGREGSMWPNLPTWFLPTWLLQDTELGRSGNERYNLFALNAEVGFINAAEQAAQAKPVWHKQDIRAHGLRPMETSTRFIAQFRKGIGDWLKVERPTWQRLLVDWYASMPYLRSGSLIAKTMLPEIRIGQRVIVDPGNVESQEQFYCEGTQLDFTAPTATSGAMGSTALTVTHGFRGDDDSYFKAIEGQSKLFKETF